MAVVSLTTCAHVHGVDTCVLIYLRTGVNLMRYWAILEPSRSECHLRSRKSSRRWTAYPPTAGKFISYETSKKKERCQHFVSDGMK